MRKLKEKFKILTYNIGIVRKPIGDILDYAASKDSKFDFENNTRDFLLNYFELEDGENSLEKAKVNYKIVECLRNL